MRAHRIAAAAAGGALGLLAGSPLAALASTAPTGSGSGSVLTVGSSSSPIAAVSSTSANAGPTSDGSSAGVVDVAGSPIVGGSSANGSGPSSGDLLDTGSTSPVEVKVAPWSASSTTPSGGSSSSEGQAAVADATAGSASLAVGQSDSKAYYTSSPGGTGGSGSGGSTQSGGSTTTDGVILNGPGLYVDLLHADANSNGTGSSYLADINGTQIPPSRALQGICNNLNIPSVLALNCVSATGGAGNLFEYVAQLKTPGGPGGLPVTLVGAGGIGGGVGTAAAGMPTSVKGTSETSPIGSAPAGPGTASSGTGSGSLPFTGAPIALWVLGSMALLGLGGVTVKASSLVAPQLFG